MKIHSLIALRAFVTLVIVCASLSSHSDRVPLLSQLELVAEGQEQIAFHYHNSEGGDNYYSRLILAEKINRKLIGPVEIAPLTYLKHLGDDLYLGMSNLRLAPEAYGYNFVLITSEGELIYETWVDRNSGHCDYEPYNYGSQAVMWFDPNLPEIDIHRVDGAIESIIVGYNPSEVPFVLMDQSNYGSCTIPLQKNLN